MTGIFCNNKAREIGRIWEKRVFDYIAEVMDNEKENEKKRYHIVGELYRSAYFLIL